ncbi:MAG: FIST C-terminal domain-containing protein [Labilithrix sp.]|nr:FIST C-terminal domain-containing protein [Labilithrix sp.]MCW5815527.1 FIST C-terminal domain-containing protein [Labilithrix sp.]
MSYDDTDVAARAVRDVVGDIPIVGGTSGACVIGASSIASRGVSVVLLGGEDIEVATRAAALESPELMDVVPAARGVAEAADEAAKRGLDHYSCLVFAPGIGVDGEALVAAVRKGLGARAQLAGGFTGDDLTMDRPRVFVRDELRRGEVVLAGLFTKKHVGISARHGWRAVGPKRTVTRADGPRLLELDGRPALEVWLEDALKAGAVLPPSPKDLLLYLANHYEIGITDATTTTSAEVVARAPWALHPDGSVTLSGSVGEGRHIRLVHASRKDLLRASTNAASDAVLRAGSQIAGALVFACAGRLAALGDDFAEEPRSIRERVAAPIGGACVFGEIAKTERDVDAFFNTTAVVVAFAA